MPWKPNSEERIQAFDASFGPVPGASRMVQFGCPGYAKAGKVFAILQEDEIILRVSESDATTALAAGARLWSPMKGRPPSKNYIVVPDEMARKPSQLKAWTQRSVAFVDSLPAKKK